MVTLSVSYRRFGVLERHLGACCLNAARDSRLRLRGVRGDEAAARASGLSVRAREAIMSRRWYVRYCNKERWNVQKEDEYYLVLLTLRIMPVEWARLCRIAIHIRPTCDSEPRVDLLE